MAESSSDPALATTERTFITRLLASDAPFILQLVNSPGWLQYIGDKEVKDEFNARRFIKQRFLSSYDSFGYGYYLVKSIELNTPMGIVGFTNREEYDNPDFGFAFLPEFEGQGFAREASVAIMDYGQREFGFPVLDAGTLPENHSAARLLARLGFKAQGKIDNKWGHGQLILHRWWPDV